MRGIAIRYGVIMAIGFTLYFLLMVALGFGDNFYFRILNAIIHIAIITIAIKQYKDKFPEDFNYLSGVSAGVVTSLIGVIPFALFMLIFLSNSPDLMEAITARSEMLESYLTPFTASLVILMEGIAVSFVASYIIMRIIESYR